MSLLIKDALLDGKKKSIYVEDGRIVEMGEVKVEADRVLDGKGKAVLPGLVNAHTHAAMTLMRGYADDLRLHDWLSDHIWPLEAKLTEDDVYWGTRLACLEMIKSGTTCFNDMYWHFKGSARAVEEAGIRAVLSAVFIDLFDEEKAKEQQQENKRLFRESKKYSDRVVFALGPHAVYTVSAESLRWAAAFSEKHDVLIHFHLAETRKENEDCVGQNRKRPVPYLEELGFLGERLVAAHCIWLTKSEVKTLAEYDVKAVHNPTSNMKLATGGVIPYPEMREAGLTVALGTDGCASNNNLDMTESMKYAALLQKAHRWEQTVLPAPEAFEMASAAGARALGLDAGVVEEGRLADLILIDLRRPEMTPGHNLVSDIVYAANGSCVSDVVCDGRVLMEDRVVEGEKEVLEKARAVARDLVKRK